MDNEGMMQAENEMPKMARAGMRKVSMLVSILMGVSMSFVLSLIGTLLSGHFTIISWAISFFVSLVISIIIGFVIPMRRINDAICYKFKVRLQSFKGLLLGSFVSDLIYTPIITICMVLLMTGGANRNMDMVVAEKTAILEQLNAQQDQLEDVDQQLQGQIKALEAEIDGINSHRPSFAKEFPLSFIVCFVVGLGVIMFLQPKFLKAAMMIHLGNSKMKNDD